MDREQSLAPYAAKSATSKGRLYSEEYSSMRTEFQRDRDRIIHCAAFRRLEYKTQVFVNHEGDLFRTRLTHSLEVAQIARSIAGYLNLNEDLVETIALAHDLGHTPFGHAGQDALNACMEPYGGFEHNLQSLRIVDELEERYAKFNGLNLTFEAREGILKHCAKKNAENLGELGRRFLENTRPSLEAQLTDLSDAIAYNNHDIDDGLRSGILTEDQLDQVDVYARHRREVEKLFPNLTGRRAINETVRRMINEFIVDLVTTSRANIADVAPQSIAEVREARRLIQFSDEMHKRNIELKKFLRDNLYKHYVVNRMTAKAHRVVTELFNAFYTSPELLPPDYKTDEAEQPRRIADYIAGMTDRFAIAEHKRLFDLGDRS